MILFFDVYIVSWESFSKAIKDKKFDINVLKASIYRNGNDKYKFISKLEITKYTLLSYSIINWSEVFIRFECEDKEEEEKFINFCKKIFPECNIENNRSDTSDKFYQSLKKIKKFGNPWIWFCPNNDHPFLSDPDNLNKLISYSEVYEEKYNIDVSILYSHFSESMNNYNFFHYLYRDYYLSMNKKINETKSHILTLSERFTIDSIKIFRLELLLEIFKNNKNKKRVIRTEDTSFYMIDKPLLTVCSKTELCRHYDSYSFAEKVPPLFIPNGIYDSSIKVAYGFSEYKKNYININPNLDFKDIIDGKTDLINREDRIPFFWINKIKKFEKNKDFDLNNKKFNKELIYLNNPFKDEKIYIYIFVNFYRLFIFYIKKIISIK